MNAELVARTIPDPDKERNGDAFVHAVVQDGSAVLAMVADGVGSCPCDWLASETACRLFAEKAKGLRIVEQTVPAELEQMLRDIDLEIHWTTGLGRGMKCAAAVVMWLPETGRAWVANVGDTRI